MRRIYLDLDGVLWLADSSNNSYVSTEAVRLVNLLSAQWNAVLVLVSSRRNTIPWPQLLDTLRSQGLEQLAVEEAMRVPLRWAQGDAIEHHLEQAPGEFVVIDDDEKRYLAYPQLRRRLVVPSNRHGFNAACYEKACALCNLAPAVQADRLVEPADDEL